MRRPLTPRQQQVLDLITQHASARGYAPTTVELGEALGIHAGAAREYIIALQRKGYVTCEPYAARTLSVVNDDTLVATVRVFRRDGQVYAVANKGAASHQTSHCATFDCAMGLVARWIAGAA